MKRILITATALTLALTSTAAAHHPPPPADPGAGDPDRVGVCVEGVFLDLVDGQWLADPNDPRWAGKVVLPAMVDPVTGSISCD